MGEGVQTPNSLVWWTGTWQGGWNWTGCSNLVIGSKNPYAVLAIHSGFVSSCYVGWRRQLRRWKNISSFLLHLCVNPQPPRWGLDGTLIVHHMVCLFVGNTVLRLVKQNVCLVGHAVVQLTESQFDFGVLAVWWLRCLFHVWCHYGILVLLTGDLWRRGKDITGNSISDDS